jgi:hypothetical protein
MKKVIAVGGRFAVQTGSIGHVYGKSGDDAKARENLHELKQLSTTTYVPLMALPFVYLGLQEYDLAIEILERACENRETTSVFFSVWPNFDPLRDDPRFQNLERRIGLRA